MPPSADISLGIHTLLLAAGLVQGLVLGASLALNGRRRNRAVVFLGLALVTFSLTLIDDVLFESRLLLRFPFLADVFSIFIFLPAPLLYLYVRSMTNPERRLRTVDFAHFVPFVLLVIALIPELLRPLSQRLADVQALYYRDDFYFNIFITLPLMQVFAYLGAIAWQLVRHTRRVREEFSSLDSKTLRWVWALPATCLSAAVIWLISYWLRWPLGLSLLDIAFAVGVYAFGYLGWRQPAIPAGSAAESESVSRDSSKPKYAKSTLTAEQIEAIRSRLLDCLHRDKPFLDSELTLSSLAARLGISPHNLSRVINDGLNTSFFDLINSHRVREAQRLLSDPARGGLTILAIAFDAGFKSKSAFNASFRRHTGMTPSAFLDESRPDRIGGPGV